MPEPTIVKTKKLTERPHLNLFETQYKCCNTGDKVASWIFASRKHDTPRRTKPDAVMIIPFWVPHPRDFKITDIRLVLVKEYRVPIQSYEYGFPAGLIDEGEMSQFTASRELTEETGLEIDQFLCESPQVFSSAGMTDESCIFLFVRCVGEPSNANQEVTENIEVVLADALQISEILINKRNKISAKAWPILKFFQIQGDLDYTKWVTSPH